VSEPVDLHTLGVVVAALRTALEHDWKRLGGETYADVLASQRACRATLLWAEALCKGAEPEA